MAHIGKGGLGAYQRLYDPCLSAPVWMRNVWRIAASWNAAIFDLLGYAPEESIGQSLATIVPDRLKERHRSVIATYIKAGERHLDWNSIVLPGLHKEGSEI